MWLGHLPPAVFLLNRSLAVAHVAAGFDVALLPCWHPRQGIAPGYRSSIPFRALSAVAQCAPSDNSRV